MPVYEYACKSCGQHLEVAQSFKDEPLTACPACEGPLRKVFGSIGISFKGSGFYRTDSRMPAKKESAKKEAGDKATADSGSSTGGSAESSGSSGSAEKSGTGSGDTATTSGAKADAKGKADAKAANAKTA